MNKILVKCPLIIAVSGIVGCIMAGYGGGKGAAQNSTSASSANSLTATDNSHEYWLDQKGTPTNLVYLSISEESLGKLMKAVASNQPIFDLGILARNGNAFAAYQKTSAEILENKGTRGGFGKLDRGISGNLA
ncbi:MAG: hypothetical protein JXA73_04595 [Acidobacteria bacterium]|nr:hypothetical protein [Acidobacteriota bacterium]